MPSKNPELLVDVLRATLVQVEQTSGVSPDDPALAALRNIVLQRIADLELEKVSSQPEAGSEPVIQLTSSDVPAPPLVPLLETPRDKKPADN